jgi:hypothetical protein
LLVVVSPSACGCCGAVEKWNPKAQYGHGQKQHETISATENIEFHFQSHQGINYK